MSFLLFLTFLFAIFNNSLHSMYVNNYCIVSFDTIPGDIIIIVRREVTTLIFQKQPPAILGNLPISENSRTLQQFEGKIFKWLKIL